MAERRPDFYLREPLPKDGDVLRLDRRIRGNWYTAGDLLQSCETGEIVEVYKVLKSQREIHVLRGQKGTEQWWQPAGTGWLLA